MNTSIKQQMGIREWAMLIILSIFWGGSFFFNEIAVMELPPLSLVALRVGLASICLWLIVFAMKLPIPKTANTWLAFLGIGLLNNVIPFVLIVWGQTQIASGLASILNATTPLFTVVIASLFLVDEKATPLKITGVVVGFLGVVFMIGLPALEMEHRFLPQLAILMASLSYAFAGVYGRKIGVLKINPIVIAAGQVTASTLVLIPLALWVDGPTHITGLSLETWLAVIALAILSTVLGYILYFKLLTAAGATNAVLVTLLVPVSAILLGSLFLGETLQLIHFFGMAMIALGFSAIDGRLWEKVNLRLQHKY